jgi:hypothetical protein
MIVPEARYEEAVGIAKKVFESVTVTNANGGKFGDIGPLASQVQFDKVTGYIKKGIAEGARLVTGGADRPAGFTEGYFVQPTVFADVNNKMAIAQVYRGLLSKMLGLGWDWGSGWGWGCVQVHFCPPYNLIHSFSTAPVAAIF